MSGRNNARRIWASTPQNCATTNRFFVNGNRLFRNGVTSERGLTNSVVQNSFYLCLRVLTHNDS